MSSNNKKKKLWPSSLIEDAGQVLPKNFHFYRGPSMFPTFRPGDLLHTVAYERLEEVRVGDAVIYHSPRGDKAVHRVIEIKKDKIRTRGDNNDRADSYMLNFSDLIGRVDRICHGKKTIPIPVYRGGAGSLWHGVTRARGFLWRFFRSRLGPVYRGISIFSAFIPVIPKDVKSVLFRRPEGRELHILAHGRAVAKKNLKTGKESILFPYAFFYAAHLKKCGFSLRNS